MGVCPKRLRIWRMAGFFGCEGHGFVKESLFLLWVEEMSQTSRGARMGWVYCSSSLQDTRAQESNCLSVLSVPKLLIHPGFLHTHTHTHMHKHTHTHMRAHTHTHPGFLRNPVEKWQDSSCHLASLPFSALPPTPVTGVRKDSPFETAAASGGWRKALPPGVPVWCTLAASHDSELACVCRTECVVQKVNSPWPTTV